MTLLMNKMNKEDIVLDYHLFDTCVHILSELSFMICSMNKPKTSSHTYTIHLCIYNALDNIPCDIVRHKLMDILVKYGWENATRQIHSDFDSLALGMDIEALADRLLAN